MFRVFSKVFLLAMLWGPSFMFMKIAVKEMNPFWVISLRMIIASCFLWILTLLQLKKVTFKFHLWKSYFISGLFACSLPFTLFCFAARHVDSGLLGILNGLTPLFTLITAHFFIPQEKISPQKMISIFLGLTGFGFIFLPTLLDGHFDADSWGILAGLGSALCYSVGMVYAKIKLSQNNSIVDPTCQVSAGAIINLIIALIFEPFPALGEMSFATHFSVVGLAFFGTAMAFWVYFHIIERHESSVLALSTFLLPMIAIMWGVFLLGEKLSLNTVLGGLLILSGLWTSLYASKRNKNKKIVIRSPFSPRPH